MPEPLDPCHPEHKIGVILNEVKNPSKNPPQCAEDIGGSNMICPPASAGGPQGGESLLSDLHKYLRSFADPADPRMQDDLIRRAADELDALRIEAKNLSNANDSNCDVIDLHEHRDESLAKLIAPVAAFMPHPNYPDMSNPEKRKAAEDRAKAALTAPIISYHEKLARDVLGLFSYISFLERRHDEMQRTSNTQIEAYRARVTDLESQLTEAQSLIKRHEDALDEIWRKAHMWELTTYDDRDSGVRTFRVNSQDMFEQWTIGQPCDTPLAAIEAAKGETK